MIYFDAAYIAKCYVHEHGAEDVRTLAYQIPVIYSCELARLELSCVLHRHLREGHIAKARVQSILDRFEEDERGGIWTWFPITPDLLQVSRVAVWQLPKNVFLRAGDALHLACAKENGFTEIYSNDRHLLAAAKHFGLKGVNVISR